MPQQLDRAEFRDWLAAMPRDAVAGYPRKPDDCPLAAHIQTTLLLPGAWVGLENWYENHAPHVLPCWARRFVSKLAPFRIKDPITAAECIQILDTIPEEE